MIFGSIFVTLFAALIMLLTACMIGGALNALRTRVGIIAKDPKEADEILRAVYLIIFVQLVGAGGLISNVLTLNWPWPK